MIVEEAIEKLRTVSDERINNGEPITVPAAMSPGDMIPQGDIGLLMLDEVPDGAVVVEAPLGGQLAPGSSKGSRHCIPRHYLSSIKFYSIDDGDPLSDLVIEAIAPFDLVHPEHADHLGYPAKVYRVRHQQSKRRTRVLD